MPATPARLLLLAALPSLVRGAWPPGSVRRAFYETPKGYLHYVVKGNLSAAPPFVFFHAHPRSTEQMKVMMAKIPDSQPMLAVDYFGAGFSDECQCNESIDEYVPYTTFAQWVLDICDHEGVTKMIPLGSLTGASGAMELAWLAAKQGRVAALVQFEAYYLSPRAKKYIDNVYIPTVRHLPIYQNGSHLLFWWDKPDAGPIGPTTLLNGTGGPVTSDLLTNEQKTVDSLLAMRTGWEVKIAWSQYNSLIPSRLQDLTTAGVKQLYIDAGFADWLGNKYGLDKDWSRAQINAIVPSSLRVNYEVANATEGAFEQNATICANVIRDFLGGWPA